MQDSGAFPQTACSLVQAGEHSGHMEDMTELLASYYERLCDERSQLRNMMIYPTFLFVCINILFFGALVLLFRSFPIYLRKQACRYRKARECYWQQEISFVAMGRF